MSGTRFWEEIRHFPLRLLTIMFPLVHAVFLGTGSHAFYQADMTCQCALPFVDTWGAGNGAVGGNVPIPHGNG